jgi:hypothetical protein
MHQSTYQPVLTFIRIPTDDVSYKTMDPKEIEERLIDCNLNHYAQAENTAMADHLICEKMGISGTYEFCNDILKGTADVNNLPYPPSNIPATTLAKSHGGKRFNNIW